MRRLPRLYCRLAPGTRRGPRLAQRQAQPRRLPDTSTSVGSAASRRYCSELRSIPTATKKGITWFIRDGSAPGPRHTRPSRAFPDQGRARSRLRPVPVESLHQRVRRRPFGDYPRRGAGWAECRLLKYVPDLALDADRVRRELASHADAGRVAEDRASGLASGVRGTPTFYIDGARYDGSVALGPMRAAMRATPRC